MKFRIATVLAAGLIAGGAFAQTTTNSPMQGTAAAPTKPGTPTEAAGAAQGRAPTSVNMPQTGPKMASPKGSIDTGVVSTPSQAQGSTSTAPENVMRHDNKVQHTNAPRDGMGHNTQKSTMHKNTTKKNKETPVTLTTPAPGPANTTPAGPATGAPPATR